MKRSPLYDAQRAAGAEFHPVPGGWETPAHFGDPVGEARQVRQGAGLIDLSYRGKLRLIGRDRLTFLHAILSQDLASLPSGESRYAMLLNATGHALSDMWVHAEPDSVLLDLEPGRSEDVSQQLDNYLIRERVLISEVTDEVALLSVQGPRALAVLQSALPDVPDLPENANATLDMDEGSALVCAHSRTGERGFDLFVTPDAARTLWATLAEAGAAPIGFLACDALRIEAGIPRFGQDFDEGNIALEAGAPHAISLDKGCYVGQEIIARIDSRGHTNRILRGLTFAAGDTPEMGAKVRHEGKTVGAITSAVLSPTLGVPIALGIIRHEASASGTAVTVGPDARPATVADLPFVNHNRPLEWTPS